MNRIYLVASGEDTPDIATASELKRDEEDEESKEYFHCCRRRCGRVKTVTIAKKKNTKEFFSGAINEEKSITPQQMPTLRSCGEYIYWACVLLPAATHL